MNFKRTIIIAVILIITLVVASFIFKGGNNFSFIDKESEDVKNIKTSAEIKKEIFSEKTDYYTISLEYPVTENSSVNAYIKEFVDKSIESFREDVSWAKDGVEGDLGSFLSLTIAYENIKTEKVQNYVFSVGTYTGGAHGMYFTKVMRFTPEGVPVSISDLFLDFNQGLSSVSSFVQKELMKGQFADKDWVSDGAAPKNENYQNLIVNNNSLKVIFDPYQVAPYAAGVQKIEIPLSVFEKNANMDYFIK